MQLSTMQLFQDLSWGVKMIKTKPLLIAALTWIVSTLILGVPTDVIPNDYFMRISKITFLDKAFVVIIPLLIAYYAYLIFSRNKTVGYKSSSVAVIAGYFGVACPMCIHTLVIIFGSSLLMTYFDPVRPILGLFSVGLLLFAINKQRRCEVCK